MEREKYVLRLKVIEILRRYSKVQQHFHIMRAVEKTLDSSELNGVQQRHPIVL